MLKYLILISAYNLFVTAQGVNFDDYKGKQILHCKAYQEFTDSKCAQSNSPEVKPTSRWGGCSTLADANG